MQKTAILYQAQPPPFKNGVQKPMKSGGYSDSGADIGYELQKNGLSVVTPVKNPDINSDKDWVFPDTESGIQEALNSGANTFWLNTVLYHEHPITHFFDRDIRFVGQTPDLVDIYDDKYHTNKLLRKNKIPVPENQLIHQKDLADYTIDIGFPLVVKPLRGRGSQGVFLVSGKTGLDKKLNQLFLKGGYGNSVYVEQFLGGREITITVMPSGTYALGDLEKTYDKPWCLPAVKRFNHQKGIAPYSRMVAVMENSSVLEDSELGSEAIQETCDRCVQAAEIIGVKAPIRIDCRADGNGNYFLFDLNLKPNMTGPSRPHRKNQDSLSLLAARKLGWNYSDLLKNMLRQTWSAKYQNLRT